MSLVEAAKEDAAEETILRAMWVAPMDRPVIRDGAVALRGEFIVGVGTWGTVRADFPGATVTECGDALMLPGLVNAHVHLELSDLSPPSGNPGLADWLGQVVKQSALPGEAGARGCGRQLRQALRNACGLG